VISVLLADDQSMLRTGFRMILEAEPDITVVGEAGDGAVAASMTHALAPDVVLMDVRMPQMDGIEATRRIAQDDPHCRVLILTTFDLDEYVFAGLRAGASGFLLKDAPTAELLAAIRTVAAGEAVLAPAATRRLIDRFVPLLPEERSAGHEPPDPLAELTVRERAVFTRMAAARSNREIADELYLSEGTVKVHVRSILTKLNLRDRVQAVVLAYETGILSPRGR
jgi:DNA-binding NarL/FixJ family response regulator